MLKKISIYIIILCSLKLYSIAFLPEFLVKVTEWIGIGMILALLVIYMVYQGEKQIKKHFTLPVLLIFLAVFLSMIGSNVFQDQSIPITAYAQRAIYYYLIYFLLHYMKPEGKFIVKTILIFAVVYMGIYYLQSIVYPMELTTSKMFIDRGTLRIFMDGSGYLVIAFYIWLYLTFRNYSFKYLLALFLSMGVFVLLGTRQVLAVILLITILFILQSRVVKAKALLFLLMGIALIPIFFLFESIILSMFEVTRTQSQNLEGGIRLEAAKFFLQRFIPNELAHITGNGSPGSSIYGLRLARYSEEYGYYLSDIGLIGEYVKYGIIYVLAVGMIFFRVFRRKLPENLMFIKYNFLGMLLTLVTGGGAFGSSSENIILICFLLYLIDLYVDGKDPYLNDESKSIEPQFVKGRPVMSEGI